VQNLDSRVPAVLLRIDRNPFHHGTPGAVLSLGRAGVEVHPVADSEGSPVRRSRFVSETRPRPPPGSSLADIAAVLRQVAARVSRPAVLVPLDDVSALAVSAPGEELASGFLLPRRPRALAERVADKAEPAALCESVGVPHPVALMPRSPEQAAAAAWQLGLPLVTARRPVRRPAMSSRPRGSRPGASGSARWTTSCARVRRLCRTVPRRSTGTSSRRFRVSSWRVSSWRV
jgi:predicted ATP-grasp superfamily ATP-dependent carboligase